MGADRKAKDSPHAALEQLNESVRIRLQEAQLENEDLTRKVKAKQDLISDGLQRLKELKRRHQDSSYIIDQLKKKNTSLVEELNVVRITLQSSEAVQDDLKRLLHAKDNRIRTLSEKLQRCDDSPDGMALEPTITKSLSSLVVTKKSLSSSRADRKAKTIRPKTRERKTLSNKKHVEFVQITPRSIGSTAVSLEIIGEDVDQEVASSNVTIPNDENQDIIRGASSHPKIEQVERQHTNDNVSTMTDEPQEDSKDNVRRGKLRRNDNLFTRDVTNENLKVDNLTTSNMSAVTIELICGTLSKVSLLSSLAKEQQQFAAYAMSHEEFKTGEEVIKQGEPGEKLFIIETGVVHVIKNGTKVDVIHVLWISLHINDLHIGS